MEPTVNEIMDYEQGIMEEDQIVDFFQRLINSGLAFKLQGHYGRTAMQLVKMGLCTLPSGR